MLAFPIRLTTDEGGIRVSCRDLPELLTWGDDEAEALAMAADATAVLLSDAREAGLAVPVPSEALDGELLVVVATHQAERPQLGESPKTIDP